MATFILEVTHHKAAASGREAVAVLLKCDLGSCASPQTGAGLQGPTWPVLPHRAVDDPTVGHRYPLYVNMIFA